MWRNLHLQENRLPLVNITNRYYLTMKFLLGIRRILGLWGRWSRVEQPKRIVVRTGMNTEMGKIADLNPKYRIDGNAVAASFGAAGKILIIVPLHLTILVVVAGIMHGQPPYAMFLAGVSLAVAAIPEGLAGNCNYCAGSRCSAND